MKHSFIKTIALGLAAVATLSSQAFAATPNVGLNAPVALKLSMTGSAALVDPGAFTAPIALLDAGSPGDGALAGMAAASAKPWETLAASGSPAGLVPLPEPSSETALYFLSGAVGLALVVMRRRTLA